MSPRKVLLSLSAVAICFIGGCAVETLDPADPPTESQSSSLTNDNGSTQESTPPTDSTDRNSDDPGALPDLTMSGVPDKPSPDPWRRNDPRTRSGQGSNPIKLRSSLGSGQ